MEDLNYAFIQDPRSRELNPTVKLAGHIMTSIIDYAKENDLSQMTLEDVFDYCYKIQGHHNGTIYT